MKKRRTSPKRTRLPISGATVRVTVLMSKKDKAGFIEAAAREKLGLSRLILEAARRGISR